MVGQEQLEEYQLSQLKKLLMHDYENVLRYTRYLMNEG